MGSASSPPISFSHTRLLAHPASLPRLFSGVIEQLRPMELERLTPPLPYDDPAPPGPPPTRSPTPPHLPAPPQATNITTQDLAVGVEDELTPEQQLRVERVKAKRRLRREKRREEHVPLGASHRCPSSDCPKRRFHRGGVMKHMESRHGVAVPKHAHKALYELNGSDFDEHMAALLNAGLQAKAKPTTDAS
ncbi:hypothetical protein FA95DRAFT_1570074 [Auriscalpium vulgare]|uniref:Uncharacterized protein n=1 Tax=Auriscalpium vulgare TaxID=40419 RepID=A0ACB8S5L7_9AGAM|nr:hypothetical protein FA95DRAFT_1570074 [Auriscalpium vulgare]